MGIMKEIWEDMKAWRRGERRVAPLGTRGRVYAPRNGEPDPEGGNKIISTAKGRATIRAKITRADGTVEDLGVLTDQATVERV